MDARHLDELKDVERRYWWHRAKRALVKRVLRRHLPPPGRLVEGGVGAGANLLSFARWGFQVSGLDIAPAAIDYCRSRGLADVKVHDLQQPWPVASRSARAVVLLDVLEHLANPVAALRHAAKAIESGGGIVFTVPAGPSLMGPWDEMLGHFRRYTPALMRQQAEKAGLRVAWLSHWNAFTYPPAWIVRRLQRWQQTPSGAEFPKVSPLVNRCLLAMAAGERWFMRGLPVPIGLSLVGVLKP
jgi:SAM-dependent methyltransferase